MNTTTAMTVTTPAIGRLALYIIRYYTVWTGLSLTIPHGDIEHVFVMTHTANIVTKPNNIIAATLFVMDTSNVVLYFITDCSKKHIDREITKAADLVGIM